MINYIQRVALCLLLMSAPYFALAQSTTTVELSNEETTREGKYLLTYEDGSIVTIENYSGGINNASAWIESNKPNRRYIWSKADVAMTSNKANDLAEGLENTLIVLDSAYTTEELTETIELDSVTIDTLTGDSVRVMYTEEQTKELKTFAGIDTSVYAFTVPAESGSEKINSTFKPIVGAIGAVMFWDPFAAIGIYDPVIYDEEGNALLNANGTKQTKGIPFVVVWLVLGSLFFTIWLGFVNIRGFKHAIDLVRGKFDKEEDAGEVSHFQALTTALSGTVGLGNIAGVAVAVATGGAGATFWMIMAGLLGMSAKFAECTLGVKYRHFDDKGEVYGGPMYYLSQGLGKWGSGWGVLGKVLAVVFAILCVGGSFGGGNMFQANQAFQQISGEFAMMQGQGVWFGLALAFFVAVVIIGGIKSIARVTDKIVPFMVGIYVVFAIVIILANVQNLGAGFAAIFNGAFSPAALKGGIIGVLIIGFQRAAFSNEAGVGSASIAHSAAKTKEPVSEGMVSLLEPFIDTVVVCTMTALVLIFTGFADDTQGLTGSSLTSAAFSSVVPWFKYVLTIAIVLFAFSTMISWSYYGGKAWGYLFGESKIADYIYKAVFVTFIVIGSASELGAVLDFSDMMILGMAFPNVLGLLLLSSEIRKDLASYWKRLKDGTLYG